MAKKVWLGLPTTTDVMETLQSVIIIEKTYVMDPGDGTAPEIFGEFQALLNGMELGKPGRYPFYDACEKASLRLAISTGEQQTFANLLITVGVT